MKLLFDQNISFRIIPKITDIFPEAMQIKQVGLENARDIEIWEYAKKNDFAIVTFDSDFYDLGLLRGIPPKVIWLRIGNTSTNSIISVIRDNQQLIEEFLSHADYLDISCLEID